jgi:hypothetical protein
MQHKLQTYFRLIHTLQNMNRELVLHNNENYYAVVLVLAAWYVSLPFVACQVAHGHSLLKLKSDLCTAYFA